MTTDKLEFLTTLEDVIRRRATDDADHSYTASLFSAGTRRIAQKVGEEGVEVALAATAGNKTELLEESADLLYHLLVLLADSEVTLADAVAVLEARHTA
jgi:phosphoribosyl-ATP pyrophosphohydrolase